jgi:serine/threonine-protein kinase
VATLPPGAEEAVPLPAADSGVPDSLPPDSLTFDSLPPDSQPFDAPAFDAPYDSQPFDTRQSDGPDSLPYDDADSVPFETTAVTPKPPADPFDPHPPEELPAYLGGRAANPADAQAAAAAAAQEAVALPMADQPTIAQVGRYALKRHLGLGGLGQVHEAWDPLLSRTVAIKTLQFESDPRTRSSLDRLFLNEARAVAGLSHPNIVTVYDAGLSPSGVYLAMERLQGRDLRQRLGEGWKPGPAVAAQLVRRVADALSYAHARGVVHCDIKPGNIFISGSDKPKVLDFGIARVAHRRAIPALEGMVAGSPHYLAPEQLLGKDVDARTDVYSLGVVFYELLSGRRAFGGDSVEQITTAVLTNHPAPAHLIRSGVPESLSAIAARAMARDPESRYATASEMAADIRNWFEQPRPAPETTARTTRAEAKRAKEAQRKAQPPRPSRWPWAVGGAAFAVLALLAVGGILVSRQGPKTSAAPQLATAPAAAGQGAPGAAREGDLMMSGGTPVMGAAAGASADAASASAALPSGATGPETGGTAAAASTAVAGAAPVAGPSGASGASAAPGTLLPSAPAAPATAGADAAAGKPATRTAGAPARNARETAAANPNATGSTARRNASAQAGSGAQPAAAANGVLQLAISPWGEVEVDGQRAGTTPPLTQLTLPAGTHTITVRNTDFPPFSTTVQVQADKPAVVRHRFSQ